MSEVIAKLVIKKTDSSGITPTSSFLDYGELALNYRDGKLFFKNASNTVEVIGKINSADLTSQQTFLEEIAFNKTTNFKSTSMDTLNLDDGEIIWDASQGNIANVILTQYSQLFTVTNFSPGVIVLCVKQNGSGNHSLAFGPQFVTVNDISFEPSYEPNSITIVSILNTGDGNFYLTGQKNFLVNTGGGGGIS